MKKPGLTYGLALLLLAFSACSKPATDQFAGSYSFKLSGSLLLVDPQAPDTRMSLDVRPSAGRLDITPTGEDDRMLLTLNALLGGVEVLYAQVEDGRLVLEPKKRTVSAGIAGGTIAVGSFEIPYSGVDIDGEVTLSGSGQRYGEALLLDLACEGTLSLGGRLYDVQGVDLVCSATQTP